MQQRNFSLLDHLLGEIDRGIKVLTVTAKPLKVLDAAAPEAEPPPLSDAERQRSGRFMRVNHSGEVAAQALYWGQALTARDPEVADAMRRAAAEETDHLAWCRERLSELNTPVSVLNPLWYAGSFGLGALAGAAGDKISLGFVAETERQVESHLKEHLQRLGADQRSRAILEKMADDERRHGAAAASLGGAALPFPVRFAMRMVSKLMTRGSYWL